MSLDELDSLLIGSDEMIPKLQSIYLDNAQTLDIKCGRKIQYSELSTHQKVKLYDVDKRFVGIGESNTSFEVLPKRLFV